MIYIKTDEEIEKLRSSCLLVSKTLAMLAPLVQPGVSTKYLDSLAEEFIRDNGAETPCKGYYGYPCATCMSVNDVVVHGIPSDKTILQEGDIISIDLCTYKDGFVGDSAYTFAVGDVSDEVRQLLRTTKESLYKGIAMAVAGMPCRPIVRRQVTLAYARWSDTVWVEVCTKTRRCQTTASGGKDQC